MFGCPNASDVRFQLGDRPLHVNILLFEVTWMLDCFLMLGETPFWFSWSVIFYYLHWENVEQHLNRLEIVSKIDVITNFHPTPSVLLPDLLPVGFIQDLGGIKNWLDAFRDVWVWQLIAVLVIFLAFLAYIFALYACIFVSINSLSRDSVSFYSMMNINDFASVEVFTQEMRLSV